MPGIPPNAFFLLKSKIKSLLGCKPKKNPNESELGTKPNEPIADDAENTAKTSLPAKEAHPEDSILTDAKNTEIKKSIPFEESAVKSSGADPAIEVSPPDIKGDSSGKSSPNLALYNDTSTSNQKESTSPDKQSSEKGLILVEEQLASTLKVSPTEKSISVEEPSASPQKESAEKEEESITKQQETSPAKE